MAINCVSIESLIVELAYKVKSIIESADKEQSDTNKAEKSKLILSQVEIELTGNSELIMCEPYH